MKNAPEIIHRTIGPWWVGGRGYVYEETYVLKDSRVMTRKQYEAMYSEKNHESKNHEREDQR